MKVIAIMNEKGGVGKTATATSLSYLLARRGKRVCLIDFDGQGHSSIIFGVKNKNQLKITVSTLLRKIMEEEALPKLEDYMIKTECGVDLTPSNSQLFALERNLCNVDFREMILSKYVDTIKDRYDYILIDCMPQMGTPMINAMMCADRLIIPTQAELLSAEGLSELLKHYQMIQKNSNHRLKIEGVLITMESSHTIVANQVNVLIGQIFGEKIPIFKTHIPRSIKVAEAVLYQQTICEYQPRNIAAIAYEQFVEELLEKIEVRQEGEGEVRNIG